MDNNINLIKEIDNKFDTFSKSQKLIAKYFLDHSEKAAYMTAARIGAEVGVSESTVVRFANTLGYSGYPEFQESLEDIVKKKLTTVERIGMNEYSNKELSIKKVFKKDMENIRSTIDEIDIDIFENTVKNIINAKKIYIIGLRSSYALAEYLGFYLRVMLNDVQVISLGISDVFEQLIRVKEEDLVIGISYPRYSKKTLEALRYVKRQGAKVVGITDNNRSPVNQIADYTLFANIDMHSLVDSLVAPMSLINSLIVCVGIEMKTEITEYFKELEGIWKEYNVYDDLQK